MNAHPYPQGSAMSRWLPFLTTLGTFLIPFLSSATPRVILTALETKNVTPQIEANITKKLQGILTDTAEIVDAESTSKAFKIEGCKGADCSAKKLAAVTKALSARFVYVAKINNVDDIFKIEIKLYDFGNQKPKAYKVQGDCEFCSENELFQKTKELMTSKSYQKVLKSKSDLPPAVYQVSISSTPIGAIITINGAEVGKAPLELEVEKGTYTIGLKISGGSNYRFL